MPLANAATLRPDAGTGVAPGGQPLAGAMFTVGTSVGCGRGNVGWAPMPADTGSVAIPLQAASASMAMPHIRALHPRPALRIARRERAPGSGRP